MRHRSQGRGRSVEGHVQAGYRAAKYMPRCASNGPFGMPTLWSKAEGNIRGVVLARRRGIPRGQRPHACTETLCAGTGRSHVRLRQSQKQTASGSPRTHADDEPTWEVGQLRSTDEVAEQGRNSGGGGDGGKAAGQGKLGREQRVPDAVPE